MMATSPATVASTPIKLLDALDGPEFQPWTLVDAAWTPQRQNGATAENRKLE